MEDQDLLTSHMSSSLLSSHPSQHQHHQHSQQHHQHQPQHHQQQQQIQHQQHQQHHHQQHHHQQHHHQQHHHQQHHHQQQQQQQHQQQQHQHSQQYIFDSNININTLSSLSSNLPDLSLNTSLSTFAPSLSLTTSASAPVLPSSTLPSSTLPSSSLSLSLPLVVSEHGRYDYDYYRSHSQSHSQSHSHSHSLTPTSATTRPASTQLQSNRNKRTKLSTEERAKVLEIRRQRACLRCKMLKIQCSRDNPCKPCLSSAVRGYERKVLSFCYCVRTRFADVDIFSSSSVDPNPSPSKTFTFGARTEVPASIRHLMDQIEPPALPAMEENVFEDTLLRWLTSASEELSPTNGSIVAMLYTIIGQSESLKKTIDTHLPSDFQTFIFTTSLVHTGWQGSVSHRDLCTAGHVCGSRIVQRLDRILTPQFLAKCDKDTHRALLLLIFGLILGVSYSTRLTTSPSFPHDLLGLEMRHSPTLWLALKEHLAQMLAHHLIFLGSTLGIKLDTASEKTIIETAVNRWNKPERSLWAGKGSMSIGMDRSAAVERSNEIALISRVFGLRGMEDFSTLQDLSGPATSQTPRTVTAVTAGDGTPTHPSTHPSTLPPTHPSTTAPTSTCPSTLPIVAVTYPDLAGLQSMPPMTANDDDEQFYHSHSHNHQREDRPLHDTLDDNPESFYTMTNDDITGLLSPVTNLPEREVDSNDNEDGEGDKSGESERESERDADDDSNSDSTDTNTNRAVAKTSTAATTSNPPPPSRSAMGNDGMVNNTRKRRSVWIVRPYSENEAQEPVNVYARFRVHQGQNLGLFV